MRRFYKNWREIIRILKMAYVDFSLNICFVRKINLTAVITQPQRRCAAQLTSSCCYAMRSGCHCTSAPRVTGGHGWAVHKWLCLRGIFRWTSSNVSFIVISWTVKGNFFKKERNPFSIWNVHECINFQNVFFLWHLSLLGLLFIF